MKCDVAVREISFVENLSWFGGDTLPGEIPLCGLHGQNCLSDTVKGKCSHGVLFTDLYLMKIFSKILTFIFL
jgi:hypothetical protein